MTRRKEIDTRGLTADQTRRRLELYRSGMSDKAIAKAEGVCSNAVAMWRSRRGLEPHPRHWDPDMQSRRLTLYRSGMTDRQIAEVEGRPAATVKAWRRRCGLPPHHSRVKATTHPGFVARHEQRFTLYRQGLTDRQIAAEAECPIATVKTWRLRHELPPFRKIARWFRTGDERDLALDAAMFSDGAGTLHEVLADPSWSNWLEEMGATAW